MVKMAGRSFGRKKNYGLTVTVSSKPWWEGEMGCDGALTGWRERYLVGGVGWLMPGYQYLPPENLHT